MLKFHLKYVPTTEIDPKNAPSIYGVKFHFYHSVNTFLVTMTHKVEVTGERITSI
jgi:hypothetical protein